MRKITSYFLVFLFSLTTLVAQNSQVKKLIVPLSKPGKPGSLNIHHHKGSITINGYSGINVEINASFRDKERNELSDLIINPIEKENTITLKYKSTKTIDLEIKVPYRFSLSLKSFDNGNIEVNNVVGEMDVNHPNGKITLTNITGSVVASTGDNDIIVSFNNIWEDSPMAFSSVEGKIVVTLPENINANFKMRSDLGQIFSEFKYKKIDKSSIRESELSSLKGIDYWTHGKVNKGGPEYIFRSISGNIYIRHSSEDY